MNSCASLETKTSLSKQWHNEALRGLNYFCKILALI